MNYFFVYLLFGRSVGTGVIHTSNAVFKDYRYYFVAENGWFQQKPGSGNSLSLCRLCWNKNFISANEFEGRIFPEPVSKRYD